MPQSLTRWNFRGYSHTKGMLTGQLDASAVTAKDFMLSPNMPRFVRVGDKYELFYFSADGWKSLGVKVAEEPKLIYNNVPSHALYWLRDLTRGNEEQVFTYYDNKQIFTEGYWNLLF